MGLFLATLPRGAALHSCSSSHLVLQAVLDPPLYLILASGPYGGLFLFTPWLFVRLTAPNNPPLDEELARSLSFSLPPSSIACHYLPWCITAPSAGDRCMGGLGRKSSAKRKMLLFFISILLTQFTLYSKRSRTPVNDTH